jgi:hypothetical protein
MGLFNLRIIRIQTFYLMYANLKLYRMLRAFKKMNNFLTKKKRAIAAQSRKLQQHIHNVGSDVFSTD